MLRPLKLICAKYPSSAIMRPLQARQKSINCDIKQRGSAACFLICSYFLVVGGNNEMIFIWCCEPERWQDGATTRDWQEDES